jgi:hypothetical protein
MHVGAASETFHSTTELLVSVQIVPAAVVLV